MFARTNNRFGVSQCFGTYSDGGGPNNLASLEATTILTVRVSPRRRIDPNPIFPISAIIFVTWLNDVEYRFLSCPLWMSYYSPKMLVHECYWQLVYFGTFPELTTANQTVLRVNWTFMLMFRVREFRVTNIRHYHPDITHIRYNHNNSNFLIRCFIVVNSMRYFHNG